MANDTQVTVIGTLGADPELKFLPSGQAVANFNIASTPRSFNKQTSEWVDGETQWFRCAVWRQAAEHCAESLTKGMRVIVQGNLVIRQFERNDGTKGTSVEINVQEVGPSLTFATAKVSKAERSTPGQQGGASSRSAPAENPWATNPSQGQVEEPPF